MEDKKHTLKEMYENLNPTSKKVAKAVGGAVALIIIYTFFSIAFRSNDPGVITEEAEQRLINVQMTGDGDKELSDRIAIQREMDNQREQFNLQLDALRFEMQQLRLQNEALTNERASQLSFPTPPETSSPVPTAQPRPPAGSQIKADTVGGIRRISITQPIQEASQKKINYFPTTSFMKGILLNGLYAPTLTKGRASPHPAFIRVEDLSILPNELRKDISGCEFMGEAYGELSDSRVHIRLTQLACTAYDGRKYLDSNVKGVVFGEDGYLGVSGTIYANFNQLLRDTFIMEFIAGFGNALSQSQTTTIISSDGTVNEYFEGNKGEKMMWSAAGQGLGQSMNRITDVYLQILEDMGPVVGINGGRHIEIKLTEGVELVLQDTEWVWGHEL